MTTLSLVYEEIKQEMLDRIGEQWPPGSRLPPATELAKELSAGQRSTLRALQELVSEGYLLSRPGRGTFVADDLPKAGNGAPSQTRNAKVALLLPQTHDRFVGEMVEALAARLSEAKCQVDYVWRTGSRPDLTTDRFDGFDAIAVIHSDGRQVKRRRNQKVVLVGSRSDGDVNTASGYDIVGPDEMQGSFLAGRIFSELKLDRVCFFGVALREQAGVLEATSQNRLRGFEKGFGSSIDSKNVFLCTSYTLEAAVLAATKLLDCKPMPEAVFAASDDLAVGLAIVARQRGLMPGKDFQLIGFDGQYAGRELEDCPPLTSIAIPSQALGTRAAELLIQRINQPSKPVERVQLGCSIYRGETVSGLPEEEML